MSKFIERRTRPTIDLESWDDGRQPTRAVAAAALLLGEADTTDATCYGWVPQAHAALGVALDVDEIARALHAADDAWSRDDGSILKAAYHDHQAAAVCAAILGEADRG